MNVLHLSSDYARQKIYRELIESLEDSGLESQFVYVPVRTADELGKHRSGRVTRTEYRFAHILRARHRVLFGQKIRMVKRDLLEHVSLSHIDVVHAHFLYSDGALALSLKEELGIPYIVAVRNTDVSAFRRFRPDLLGLCCRILTEASAVVFLSPSYPKKLLRGLPPELCRMVERKAHVIPNGIDSRWLEGARVPRTSSSSLRLLYVGDFSPNKNVEGVLRAARLLAQTTELSVTLVGGGGDKRNRIARLLDSGEFPFAISRGRVEDFDQLSRLFCQHDILVMPSFTETFGLAYIEALSHGLPVIHSRGQGVDGYFDAGTVAEGVDPSNPADIKDGIVRLAQRMEELRESCCIAAKPFNWPSIARTYQDIYDKAVGVSSR